MLRDPAPPVDALAGPSDRALLRLQAISGLAFATFLLLHLANTMLATLGQGRYDGFQRGVRGYYQWAPIELSVVIAAPLVHVAAAAVRILRRRRLRAKTGRTPPGAPGWRVRLHRYSGYYLVVVVVGHMLATRAPGVFLGIPADFSFLTFSLESMPLFFYPYYISFAFCGVIHVTHGTLLALRVLGLRLPSWATAPRSRPFWVVVSLAALMALAGVLALGGAFHPVDRGRFGEFRALYERLLPEGARPWD